MRVTRFTSGLPKVLILHHMPIVVDAIRVMLSERADVVGDTKSGRSALSYCELLAPDVVIVGDSVDDGVVEYYVPALLQSGTRILRLSHTEIANAVDLVELGITGIIQIGNTLDDLLSAVLILTAGGAYLPPDVVSSIAADWRRSRKKGTNEMHGSELTNRELEVMGAMSDGLSTKAIAHNLGISVKTVENHKTRIYDKLGVRSQAQAIALVHGRGHDAPVDPHAIAP